MHLNDCEINLEIMIVRSVSSNENTAIFTGEDELYKNPPHIGEYYIDLSFKSGYRFNKFMLELEKQNLIKDSDYKNYIVEYITKHFKDQLLNKINQKHFLSNKKNEM